MEIQKSVETAPMEPIRELPSGPIETPIPEHLQIEKSDLEMERMQVMTKSPTQASITVVTTPVPSIPPAIVEAVKSKSTESTVSTESEKGSVEQMEAGAESSAAEGAKAEGGASTPSIAEGAVERVASPVPPSESEKTALAGQSSSEGLRRSQQEVGPIMAESDEGFSTADNAELGAAEEGEVTGKRKKRRELKAMRGETLTVTSGKEAACCVCLVASIITLLVILFLVSVFAQMHIDRQQQQQQQQSPEDKSEILRRNF